jgi:hypothetical protein
MNDRFCLAVQYCLTRAGKTKAHLDEIHNSVYLILEGRKERRRELARKHREARQPRKEQTQRQTRNKHVRALGLVLDLPWLQLRLLLRPLAPALALLSLINILLLLVSYLPFRSLRTSTRTLTLTLTLTKRLMLF